MPIAHSGTAPAAAPAAPSPAITDAAIQPTSFSQAPNLFRPVARGQAPEIIATKPMPVGPAEDPSGPLKGWTRGSEVVASTPRTAPFSSTMKNNGAAPPVVSPQLLGSSVPGPGVPGPIVSSPGVAGPIVSGPGGAGPIVSGPMMQGGVPGLPVFGANPACNDCYGQPMTSGVCLPDEGRCCNFNDKVYVNLEYLLWSVKGDTLPPLVTTGTPSSLLDQNVGNLSRPDTQILFGGNRLSSDPRSGGRVTVGYWFGDQHGLGLELGGFILADKTNRFSASSLGVPDLDLPFLDVNPNSPGESSEGVAGVRAVGQLAGSVDVAHRSKLWGAEANLRTNCLCGPNGHLDFLLGYRMLGLDETLELTESLLAVTNRVASPTDPTIVVPAGTTFLGRDRFAATNRFYGAQVGVDGEYRWGNWSLGARAKVALGPTQQIVDISGSRTTTRPGQAPVVRAGNLYTQPTNIGRHTRDVFTVVPEVGVTIGYQLTEHVRATAGYNFLYWSSVARPGQNIDRAVNSAQVSGGPANPARPLFPGNSTDLWAHGLTLGLEFKY